MENRLIKGYLCIYHPDSKHAFERGKQKGFVYEHLLVLEQSGIDIPEGFEVHHLNFDKLDNRLSNLIVLSKSDHTKLHNWLNRAAMKEFIDVNRMNSGKPKSMVRYCKNCDKLLTGSQYSYCSTPCQSNHKKTKIDEDDFDKLTIEQLKDKYNLSKTHLRKLRKIYIRGKGNPEPS